MPLRRNITKVEMVWCLVLGAGILNLNYLASLIYKFFSVKVFLHSFLLVFLEALHIHPVNTHLANGILHQRLLTKSSKDIFYIVIFFVRGIIKNGSKLSMTVGPALCSALSPICIVLMALTITLT